MKKHLFIKVICILSILSFLSVSLAAACVFLRQEPLDRTDSPVSILDERFAGIRSYLLGQIDEQKIPSIAIAVAENGKIIWEEGLGWANREKQIPATPHTIYALGSLSKSITATGMMVLADKGLIDPEDPMEKHMGSAVPPDFIGTRSAIRIKHVLSMTAAIPHSWYSHDDDDPNPPLTADWVIPRHGFSVAPPGSMFLYSNLAFAFPEVIIPEVTGESFDAFMRREVFEPLGMADSRIDISTGEKNRAWSYTQDNKPFEMHYTFQPRGSGGYASAHDLILYALFHMGMPLKDQRPILKSETLEAIHRADDPEMANYNRYNMGWGIADDGKHLSWISNGNISGANSMLLIMPRKNIAIVCVSNMSGSNALMTSIYIADVLVPGYRENFMRFIEIMENADTRQEPLKVTPMLLGKWKGQMAYGNEKYPVELILAEDNTAYLKIEDQDSKPLNDPSFVDQPDTVVFGVTFSYRMLTGSITAIMPGSSFEEKEYTIALNLKYNGKDFTGYASVIKEGLNLPVFMRLTKHE